MMKGTRKDPSRCTEAHNACPVVRNSVERSSGVDSQDIVEVPNISILAMKDIDIRLECPRKPNAKSNNDTPANPYPINCEDILPQLSMVIIAIAKPAHSEKELMNIDVYSNSHVLVDAVLVSCSNILDTNRMMPT